MAAIEDLEDDLLMIVILIVLAIGIYLWWKLSKVKLDLGKELAKLFSELMAFLFDLLNTTGKTGWKLIDKIPAQSPLGNSGKESGPVMDNGESGTGTGAGKPIDSGVDVSTGFSGGADGSSDDSTIPQEASVDS